MLSQALQDSQQSAQQHGHQQPYADSAGTRVVMLTSLTYRAGRIKFDDLRAERSYSGFHRYADSKLAELLAVKEFAERMDRYALSDVICVQIVKGQQCYNAVCFSSNKPSCLSEDGNSALP